MIIIFPKLKNGNILWTCDKCGSQKQICSLTQRVSIYCKCNNICNPECNKEYYNTGAYKAKIK